MPSSQRRELTGHRRLTLLFGLAVLLVSLISVLCLVPATGAIRHQGQMLRLRLKLHSVDKPTEILPRMPIEELIRFLPQLPRIERSAIPQLIHQSYKNTTLPADFKAYRKSWTLHHPMWLYQFWTDEVGCGHVAKRCSQVAARRPALCTACVMEAAHLYCDPITATTQLTPCTRTKPVMPVQRHHNPIRGDQTPRCSVRHMRAMPHVCSWPPSTLPH
jgi:hypothetical protein